MELNGIVVPELYEHHRLQFLVEQVPGHLEFLSNVQRGTVDAVLDYYGDKGSQWLSDLTHQEEPWLRAREGIPGISPKKWAV